MTTNGATAGAPPANATGGASTIFVPGGLDGVSVGETAVGDVRGLEGFYHYRQYSAVELAAARSVEDVAHLLVVGSLPDRATSTQFRDRLSSRRALPEGVAKLLPSVAGTGTPLTTLRTVLSLTGAELGWQPTHDISADELSDQVVTLCALVPTAIAAASRLRAGLDPVAPRADLDHAANYLWMLEGVEPDRARARALEQYLIVTADHGFNSSTFAARVITSTGSDLASAMCGALGALAGPLHGGAPSRALDMLDEIAVPGNAGPWAREAIGRGERIMGFGHRVYRTDDPRALFLREVAIRLGGPLVDLATAVETEVLETFRETKAGRPIYTNVEYYAAVVLARCGIPRELFTPTFAASRTLGWAAHIIEQARAAHLIRPGARYVGPPPPQPVPPVS